MQNCSEASVATRQAHDIDRQIVEIKLNSIMRRKLINVIYDAYYFIYREIYRKINKIEKRHYKDKLYYDVIFDQ